MTRALHIRRRDDLAATLCGLDVRHAPDLARSARAFHDNPNACKRCGAALARDDDEAPLPAFAEGPGSPRELLQSAHTSAAQLRALALARSRSRSRF